MYVRMTQDIVNDTNNIMFYELFDLFQLYSVQTYIIYA